MNEGEKPSIFKKHRVDIIVIAILLIISLIIFFVAKLNRDEGAYIEVEINGSFVSKYPLSVDGVYTLNGGTNTLTVKGGVAYMTDSNCPDHTCEKSGKVKYVGQTIVCLPNKLTITIVGNSEDSVDFVS